MSAVRKNTGLTDIPIGVIYMSNKTKVLLTISALLTAFAFGRYTTPVKIKTETKIVEVEKTSKKSETETERNKHKETTVTEITRPDGTTEKTTKTVEDTDTERKTKQSEKDKTFISGTETKEIVKGGNDIHISAMIGTDFMNGFNTVYGGHIQKSLIGPISVGAWGLTNGVGGISLGLSF